MKLGTFTLKLVGTVSALVLSSCSGTQSSFSLLSTGQTFQQSSAATSNKVDILWVVDNSPSMIPAQNNILNNVTAFMTNFQSKNLDFKLAVTTTEAYLAGANFANDPTYSKFRDGATLYQLNNQGQPTSTVSYSEHTGIFVVLPGSQI